MATAQITRTPIPAELVEKLRGDRAALQAELDQLDARRAELVRKLSATDRLLSPDAGRHLAGAEVPATMPRRLGR